MTIKENLKRFQYKLAICIILFFIFTYLINFYREHHSNIKNEMALLQYKQMVNAYKKKDLTSVIFHAKIIEKCYEKTVYHTISQLFLAKNAFVKNKLSKSKKYLKNIKYNKPSKILSYIINERLIKTYVMQKKWKKALILIDFYDEKKKNYIFQEMKGDIYLQLNELVKAKQSFLVAKILYSDKNDNFLNLKIKYLNFIK